VDAEAEPARARAKAIMEVRMMMSLKQISGSDRVDAWLVSLGWLLMLERREGYRDLAIHKHANTI
jgi:hypothetical protein